MTMTPQTQIYTQCGSMFIIWMPMMSGRKRKVE